MNQLDHRLGPRNPLSNPRLLRLWSKKLASDQIFTAYTYTLIHCVRVQWDGASGCYNAYKILQDAMRKIPRTKQEKKIQLKEWVKSKQQP